jgi:tyrosine-protein kinase Etk/Wzc
MQNTSTNDPFNQEDVINIQDYVSVLIRRRKAFTIVFLTIFLAVAAYTFLMKPVYEATATLRLKEDKGKISPLDELILNNASPVNTEIELINTRTPAEKVATRLQLQFTPTVEPGNATFQLLDLSADPVAKAYFITITGPGSYRVQDMQKNSVGDGKNGLLFQSENLGLLIDDLRGETGDRVRIDIVPFRTAVNVMRENITAEENPKQTNIIKLSYKDTDPELARDVVNNLVQSYLEQTIGFKAEEADRTFQFLEQQLEKVKQDLELAERNLEAFKRTTGVMQLDTEVQALIEKLSDTEKERASITIQKKQAEFSLESLKDAASKDEAYSPVVFRQDPLIAGMAGKMADLEIQKQALLNEYTITHPLVKAVQEQINELQHKIGMTYDTSFRNLVKQEQDYTRQLEIYETKMRKLPSTERELARLTRLFKVNADIYTFLLQKREETNIAKASTISNIDIVDPAVTPEVPVKPKKLLYLGLGLSIGIMAGIILAFILENLDNTIKDADMVKRELNLPILAVIPHIPAAEAGMDNEKHASLITHYEPKSSISEAFRNLRTSIHFSGISKKRQVMMVTSCMPYEGKSTIIGNLAIILSQTGAKVLLLDCDLRRPSMHKLYGNAKAPGLTELLAGDTNVDAIIHNTQIAGLDFISAGTTPPNPAELLGSDKMKNILQTFRERYDVILLDAPPILAVTDSLLLSNMTDMVFMILELGRVPIKAAVHVREMLQNVGAPLAGVVLNDKSEEGLKRYGYYGEKYYRYGYYYGYGQYSEEPVKHKHKGIRAWMHRLLKK